MPNCPTTEISIVIPTYNRPDYLRTAIASCLAQQDVGVPYEIVVVDNNPQGSAEPIVAAAARASAVPVRYVAEPRPGISHARNTGVAAATGHYIGFLDDDQQAEPGWLAAHFDAARRFDADIVFGPFYPRFPLPDAAVHPYPRMKFTRDVERPTGAPMPAGSPLFGMPGSSNTLLNKARCFTDTEPFHPALGTTGGEDTLLFRQLLAQGRKMVWCAEAVVRETIPADRLTVGYLLRRAFNNGQINAFTWSVLTPPHFGKTLFLMAAGAAQIALFAVPALALRLIGDPRWLSFAAQAAGGLGKLLWHPRLHLAIYGDAERPLLRRFADVPAAARDGAIETSIVIPTYRRPDGLACAVASCIAQEGVAAPFEVIVVDNNPDGAARPAVLAMAADSSVPIRYVAEPRSGISHARNAGTAAASGRYVAFLDDDQEAAPGWLAALVSTIRDYRVDVVFGPFYPRFPAGEAQVDPYLQYKFKRDIQHPTGWPMPDASPLLGMPGIGNTILDRARCLADPRPFNPLLGHTGGEDTLLFRDLLARGRKMAWCAEAVVWETIPPQRLSPRYLLQRAFNNGQVSAFTWAAMTPPQRGRMALLMAAGLVQALLFAWPALALRLVGSTYWVSATAQVMGGLGKLLCHPRLHLRIYGNGTERPHNQSAAPRQPAAPADAAPPGLSV